MTTANEIDAADLLETLKITKMEDRTVGGSWVTGTVAEHRFEALFFSDRATCHDYELSDSRISKLWVQRTDDRTQVACFDRGRGVQPTTPIAQQIVDLLAAGLAETVCSLRGCVEMQTTKQLNEPT